MWRYSIPLALFVVIAAFFYRGLGLNPNDVPSALIGKQMPEFALPTLSDADAKIGSHDIAGKIALRQRMGHVVHRVPSRARVSPHAREVRHADLWAESEGRSAEPRSVGSRVSVIPYVASAFDADGTVAVDWGVTAAPETFLDRPRRQGALQAHLAADCAGMAARFPAVDSRRSAATSAAGCPRLTALAAR